MIVIFPGSVILAETATGSLGVTKTLASGLAEGDSMVSVVAPAGTMAVPMELCLMAKPLLRVMKSVREVIEDSRSSKDNNPTRSFPKIFRSGTCKEYLVIKVADAEAMGCQKSLLLELLAKMRFLTLSSMESNQFLLPGVLSFPISSWRLSSFLMQTAGSKSKKNF